MLYTGQLDVLQKPEDRVVVFGFPSFTQALEDGPDLLLQALLPRVVAGEVGAVAQTLQFAGGRLGHLK